MITPPPGMTVNFKTTQYKIDITDTPNEELDTYTGLKTITNYDYEIKKNDEKRKILILKPEYVATVIQEMRNIMKYDKSSQTIDEKTKRVFNPKIILD